jgi:hypothetical protein
MPHRAPAELALGRGAEVGQIGQSLDQRAAQQVVGIQHDVGEREVAGREIVTLQLLVHVEFISTSCTAVAQPPLVLVLVWLTP